VLVTGGGGGIGSAICRTCAVAGASVVITYKRTQGKHNTWWSNSRHPAHGCARVRG
jgi:NAD(P)-dependent dehydrogenase (short-subunit alcohol dehydrogenase family)